VCLFGRTDEQISFYALDRKLDGKWRARQVTQGATWYILGRTKQYVTKSRHIYGEADSVGIAGSTRAGHVQGAWKRELARDIGLKTSTDENILHAFV
jgi:hypothetical protein